MVVFFFVLVAFVGGSRQGAYACTIREKKKEKVGTGFVEKKNFAKIWNLGLLKKH